LFGVDAGETFGGVVAFECHVGPCLSREKARIGPSLATRLFCFEHLLGAGNRHATEPSGCRSRWKREREWVGHKADVVLEGFTGTDDPFRRQGPREGQGGKGRRRVRDTERARVAGCKRGASPKRGKGSGPSNEIRSIGRMGQADL
jgi:hypothetical protein